MCVLVAGPDGRRGAPERTFCRAPPRCACSSSLACWSVTAHADERVGVSSPGPAHTWNPGQIRALITGRCSAHTCGTDPGEAHMRLLLRRYWPPSVGLPRAVLAVVLTVALRPFDWYGSRAAEGNPEPNYD